MNWARLLWKSSRPLTAVGFLMLVALLLSLAGLIIDRRIITGAPAWLKPAKFAISTAIYSFTFAWIFTYLRDWPRLKSFVGWSTAIVFTLEVAIIDLQAARGTTSHFNASTPLDATLYAAMGGAILFLWITSIVVTIAAFRQRFDDQVLGWAIRFGLLITVFGAATGGLMTRPTAAQLAAHQPPPIVGSHTVGAPDGGPGLPGTGWSTQHGDIRVPHFIGLHATQALPLMVVLLRRRAAISTRTVVVLAASYSALFVILLIQALRGQSVVAPNAVLIAWLAATILAVVAGVRFGEPSSPRIRYTL